MPPRRVARVRAASCGAVRVLAGAALGLVALAAGAFDLQGHRGARGLAPENTLPAFEVALALGVDTLELDVGVTRDDVLVIAHDRLLNPDIVRGPDGAWLTAPGPSLRATDFAVLQAYDVGRLRPGSRYADAHLAQRPIDGTRMPSLDQLFERMAALGATRVRYNIETKLSPVAPEQAADPATFARLLVSALRRHGMVERASVQSFDWRTLREVQRIAPGLQTVYLSVQQGGSDTIRAADPAGSPWTAGLKFADHGSVARMVKAAGGQVWSPNAADIDAAAIADAQALGLKVVPWTVNDPAVMRRLIAWKVDGLITDRPDLARDAMREQGLRLPAPVPVR